MTTKYKIFGIWEDLKAEVLETFFKAQEMQSEL